jgi:hypothetical protein
MKQSIMCFAAGASLGIALMVMASVYNHRPKLSGIGWIGSPYISDADERWPSQSYLPEVEIGLRDDGIVVWRLREKEEETP